jgi:hypothetical protein
VAYIEFEPDVQLKYLHETSGKISEPDGIQFGTSYNLSAK